MSPTLGYTLLAFAASTIFTLATLMQPRLGDWNRRGEDGLLRMVFGEGRRLFANHFFVQADVYFHSGYYPSIFDQSAKPKDSSHMREDTSGHVHDEHCDHDEDEHMKQMALKGPGDWVEKFGRKFMVTAHTHLSGGSEREMLPWLVLSAEMDPQRIDTYTVAAFWLRNIGKAKEAEDFLRLGLRNNPENYELMFELGRLLQEVNRDDGRARNLWKLALANWQQQEQGKPKPDLMGKERIVTYLSRLEEAAGNYNAAIRYLEDAIAIAPDPDHLKRKVEELRRQATR